MRIGLFLILPQPEGRTQQEVFTTALADARRAEQLGLDTVWVTEHHGSAYGLSAAPSVLAAAIAARTDRVRIGYAVAVTPLHDPVRLAEEMAMVDQLSGGRLVAGFGPGYAPAEFAHLGADFAQRHSAHSAGLAAVLEHWRTGSGVLPLQRPRPPVAVTAGSPDTAARAAADGYTVLALFDDTRLGELRAAAGTGARFGVLRSICRAATPATREAAFAATRWTLQLRNRMLGHDPPSDADVAAYLDSRAVIGTDAELARALRRYHDDGIDELLCWVRWGTIDDALVAATMQALAQSAAQLPRR